jgi:ribonuclease VapC
VRIAVDASALLAILLNEPDAEVYLSKLLSAMTAWISAVNWWAVQVCMRVRYGAAGEAKSAEWIEGIGLVVEPVTPAQAKIAVDAFARYQGRPARLNMGDCYGVRLGSGQGCSAAVQGQRFCPDGCGDRVKELPPQNTSRNAN